jgi:HD-like signal output (HDOD) protein
MKQSSPLTATTPSFLESLLEDAPEILPILRQSCIQVLNLTQDKRSNASDIGDIIKRDHGMMANIIKIANSPAYCTRVPVKTPTHAVTLIGFDVIQGMVVAAQLIEQANAFGGNTSCLKHLLARALVTGTQAQEIGKALNYPEPGFLFTNALLASLGEFILALCRPEVAEQLETLRREDPTKAPKAELALLGRPLSTIAAAMAKHWHLPDSLIQLLEKKPIWPKTRPEGDQQIMENIVHAAKELSYCLLNPTGIGQERVFHTLIQQFLPPFSLSFTQLEKTVKTAFMQASEIASAINIPHQHLNPALSPDHPPLQNQQLQKLTLVVQQTLHSEPFPNDEESHPPESLQNLQPVAASSSSPDTQLMDYTLAAMKILDPSKLLTLATNTLHTSCGFERVLLAFAVPGKEKLEAKISYGAQSEEMQKAFHCPTTKGNFWHRLLHQYHPIQFLSLGDEDETKETPVEFLKLWGTSAGLVGSLYAPNKPIGVILADRGFNGMALGDTDFAAFSLILSQTNANLARLAQSH